MATPSRLSGLVAVVLLVFVGTSAAQSPTGQLTGRVTDQTGGALPGATIEVHGAGGKVIATAVTGDAGRYAIDGVPPGRHVVEFSLPNFAMVRRSVAVEGGRTQTVDARLQLALSADVAVTAKRTFRNLAEVDQPEGGLIGIADAASEGLVTGPQIDARPIMSTAAAARGTSA